MPRTIRSTFTPACEAWYSSWMKCRSTSEFILKIRCPRRPGLPGLLDLALDQVDQPLRAG